jgi:multiple sugar transport system substrate-binding protein
MRGKLAVAAVLGLVVAACGGGSGKTGGPVTLTYGLWDTNQAPVYQKCANEFQKTHPNIRIKLVTQNWNDYWGGLARGFIGETAPDVFTDHLAKYPQFAQSAVIEPLNKQIAASDVNVNQYLPGLARLWQAPNGQRYGLPKDWDTVAIISNGNMLQRAAPSSSSTTPPGTRRAAAHSRRSPPT